MLRYHYLVVVAISLIVAGFSHPAEGAEDACADPVRPLYKTICANSDLVKHHVDLVASYDQAIALAQNDRKNTLQRDQIGWTDYVESLCVGTQAGDRPAAETAACLKDAFAERLMYLNASSGTTNKGLGLSGAGSAPKKPLGLVLR